MARLLGNGLISCNGVVIEPFLDAFVMRVNTANAGTSGSDQFTIPTTGTGYNYDTIVQPVGGGAIQTTTGNTGNVTLTMPLPGEYLVGIKGIFPRIYFNNEGDRLKLLEVTQYADLGWSTDQSSSYSGCSNLVALPSGVTFADLEEGFAMFYSCSSLTDLPSSITFENLMNGRSMFFGCSSLTDLPSGITFESLTNGRSMFALCSSLQSLPSGITFESLTNGLLILKDVALNTSNYSDLLVRINANNPNTGVDFSGGNSQYNDDGKIARDALLARTPPWVITDGGLSYLAPYSG